MPRQIIYGCCYLLLPQMLLSSTIPNHLHKQEEPCSQIEFSWMRYCQRISSPDMEVPTWCAWNILMLCCFGHVVYQVRADKWTVENRKCFHTSNESWMHSCYVLSKPLARFQLIMMNAHQQVLHTFLWWLPILLLPRVVDPCRDKIAFNVLDFSCGFRI